MDFQTHQEQARQNTFRLVALLVLGIASIIAVVTALLIALLFYGSGEVQPLEAVAVAAPVTTVAIVGASLVKSSQIRSGGGSYVAASMGGRPVDFNTLDATEKQLTNIVEEIAIASGMPVPAVYVLDDEPGINAFGAGWTEDDAAIGVTRGALQHLDRAELQGVIAHEFAHVANGDTRVKTRIIGWVYGIAILTILGRLILQHMWWAPRRRDREGNNFVLMVLAVGVGLLVIGWVGSLFARMVQAAVSRQREYLADASAVQYTRNPSGIGQALMKVGGMSGQNSIRSAHATEAGHLFFSTATQSAFATHPPLPERIRRLIPAWDGTFTEPDPVDTAASSQPPPPDPHSRVRPAAGWGGALPARVVIPGFPLDAVAAEAGGSARTSSFAPPQPAQPADNGRPPVDTTIRYGPPTLNGPTDAHVSHARTLLGRIPEATQSFLHTRQGAVAAVMGALVSTEASSRREHLELVGRATFLEPGYVASAGQVITDLDRALQLPAIDIALHSIQETPYAFRRSLSDTIRAVDASDPSPDLFRWILRRVVRRHLDDGTIDPAGSDRLQLDQVQRDAATVYAVLALHNSAGPDQAQQAFEAALARIGSRPSQLPTPDALTFATLDAALAQLADLDRQGREDFVAGATEVVLHDGVATVDEAELLRVVADAVRLPVPPLLPA